MKSFFDKYLREFVYGALDGTVTTFAIIAGVAGANLSPSIVLILGISNVLADGFSMASGNYLSEKSHRDQNNDIPESRPLHMALATFCSFVIVGVIPLLPYFISYVFNIWQGKQFLVSIGFTFLAFVIIGQVRGKITNTNRFSSAIETLFIGGVAATVAYFVGSFLKGLSI